MDYIGRSQEEGISYEAEWGDEETQTLGAESEQKERREKKRSDLRDKEDSEDEDKYCFSSFIAFVYLDHKNLMCQGLWGNVPNI